MLDLQALRQNERAYRTRNRRSVPYTGTIVAVRCLTELEKLFTIKVTRNGEPIRFGAKPGQFANVVTQGKVPISVTSMPSDHGGEAFDLAIRNASGGDHGDRPLGGVTHAIHKMGEGDTVGIEGPVGNGYPMERLKGRDILLAMTGIGYFPVRSAMRHILAHRSDYGRVYIFFGVKYPSEIYFPEEVQAFEKDPDIHFGLAVSREPAWPGFKGHVTTLIDALHIDATRTSALFCGPSRMFKDVGAILTKKGVQPDEQHMSLERPMFCAGENEIGYCGRCFFNGTPVCTAGPVFSLGQILRHDLWEALA